MERVAPALRYVVVVDDDAANRDLISAVARREGLGVRPATNGISALDAISDPPPVAVIMDLEMPVMDGGEFLAELRKVPGGQSIPVIVVSGHETAPGLEDLVAAVLQKPLDVAQLATILHSLIE